jgi:cell division protein FtsL
VQERDAKNLVFSFIRVENKHYNEIIFYQKEKRIMKEKIKKFMEDQKVKDALSIIIPVAVVCIAVGVIVVMYKTYEPPETEIDPVLFAKFKAAIEEAGLI